MTAAGSIIGAFSEEQVSTLTGLSKAQLRAWNRRGLICPEYKSGDDARKPYTYIYSFRDLLKVRVLNQLRNIYRVPPSELLKVERALAHMGDDKWTKQRLWVHNRKVVFEEPESSRRREISSRQFVAEIPLEVVTSDVREDIRRLNRREAGEVGQPIKRRGLHASEYVFAGTRIPVAAVKGYLEAGFQPEEIIKRLPDLELADVEAALHFSEAA
jgi:DNA-binding transcriptional MerR regulator